MSVNLITYTYKINLSPASRYTKQLADVQAVVLDLAVAENPFVAAIALVPMSDASTLEPAGTPTQVWRTIQYTPIQPQFDQYVGASDPKASLIGLWTQRLSELLAATVEEVIVLT